MLKFKLACLAGAFLLALTAPVALAQTPPAPAMAAEGLKVTPPKLEVQEHKLRQRARAADA